MDKLTNRNDYNISCPSSFMPLSHYRQYVLRLEVLFTGRPPPRVAPFHLNCLHYRQCNSHLYAFGDMPLSFNYHWRFIYNLVTQGQNIQYLNSLKDDRITTLCTLYTVDHTFGYHSKKFICTCAKSSAHAHGTKFRGGNFINFKISIGCARKWTVHQ